VLRGVALLGIFVMNVPGFSHSLFTPPPVPDGSLDSKMVFLRELLFAGKFNLVFGALFGVGFSLQLGRLAAARGEGGATLVYARRLAVLLAIGLVHAALLWSGDVLLVYAALGFVLLAVRRLPDAAIATIVVACLAFPAASDAARPWLFSVETETVAAFEYQQFEAADDIAYGHGSFADAVAETTRIFAWLATTPLGQFTYLSFAVQMATGILLGFMVGRRRWMERLPELRGPLRRLHAASLVLAVLAGLAWWLLGGVAGEAAGETGLAAGFARTIGRAALATFYAVTVLRLLELPWAERLLRPFAYAGRMPLSNYLGQTLLASFVFYGWGLGWWGRTSPLAELLLPLGLFLVVQLPFSAFWLSRFRFGPVEYLWRRLTYGKLRA